MDTTIVHLVNSIVSSVSYIITAIASVLSTLAILWAKSKGVSK